MKEQIEEMAKVLRHGTICYNCRSSINGNERRDWGCHRPNNLDCPHDEDILKACEALYNAGYRKQSENVIELPCNIGDSCYPLPRYRKPIVERKVSRITFTKRNIIIGYYENDGQYRPPLRTRTLGEDVFLTREDAEAKIKGADNG